MQQDDPLGRAQEEITWEALYATPEFLIQPRGPKESWPTWKDFEGHLSSPHFAVCPSTELYLMMREFSPAKFPKYRPYSYKSVCDFMTDYILARKELFFRGKDHKNCIAGGDKLGSLFKRNEFRRGEIIDLIKQQLLPLGFTPDPRLLPNSEPPEKRTWGNGRAADCAARPFEPPFVVKPLAIRPKAIQGTPGVDRAPNAPGTTMASENPRPLVATTPAAGKVAGPETHLVQDVRAIPIELLRRAQILIPMGPISGMPEPGTPFRPLANWGAGLPALRIATPTATPQSNPDSPAGPPQGKITATFPVYQASQQTPQPVLPHIIQTISNPPQPIPKTQVVYLKPSGSNVGNGTPATRPPSPTPTNQPALKEPTDHAYQRPTTPAPGSSRELRTQSLQGSPRPDNDPNNLGEVEEERSGTDSDSSEENPFRVDWEIDDDPEGGPTAMGVKRKRSPRLQEKEGANEKKKK